MYPNEDAAMLPEAGRALHGEPLAFFLTWTTYGTWLPGDERGWVAKPGEFCGPNSVFERISRSRMTDSAVVLNDRQRECVDGTIEAHCTFRGWRLHAVACRSNHVHVVVMSGSVFTPRT